MDMDADVVLGRDRRATASSISACARAWSLGRRRAQVDAQHRLVRDDIVRPAAVDPRGIDLSPVVLRLGEPQRQVGGGEQGVAAFLGIAAGMGAAAARRRSEKLPLPGRAPASVPSGSAEGS